MVQQTKPRFQKKSDLTYGGQYSHENAASGIRKFMEAFGLDLKSPEFKNGEHRVVRMYGELFAGLFTEPPEVTVFPNDMGDQMVLLRDIDFVSVCSHHLVPFVGAAHVAYVPKDRIAGISKLARVVDYWAARPQIQERLTQQIAQALTDILSPRGVAVWMSASHACIACRGVKKAASQLVTSAWTGCFKQEEYKNDFLNAIGK